MPIQIDAKLSAFRRSSKGFFITLEVGPDSDWEELARAPLGQPFGVAMIPYDAETGKAADADLPTAEDVRGILAPEKKRKHWGEMSRAQRAGILCSDPEFQDWVLCESTKEPRYHWSNDPAECAAQYVRWYCGVETRALLDDATQTQASFDQLVAKFQQAAGRMAEARG
jgi:hypothetical protein